MRKPQGKLKAKQVLLDMVIFLIRFDAAIKLEENGPCWTVFQDF